MNIKDNYTDILYEFELNARTKFTDIGERTGTSQQTVSYAVNKMEEDGVINSFYPLFDYTKFGYNGYLVLFRVNTFSREKIRQLIDMFTDNDMTAWVRRLSGGWDLMIFFLAPNTSYFNKHFKELVSQYPEQLKTYTVMTSVVIHEMGRKYLNTDADEQLPDLIIGGDREQLEVSERDKEICRLLIEDPRMSSTEMAERLDTTPTTVLEHIEDLEERNLVQGYRPLLGIDELGINTSLLFIKYNKQDVEKENELRDYCKEHPNVPLLMKTIGDWDVLIQIDAEDKNEQQEIIYSIREQYEDILLDYTTLDVVDDIQKQYLPLSYFEGETHPNSS